MDELDGEVDIVAQLDRIIGAPGGDETDAPQVPTPEQPEIQPQVAAEAQQTDEGVNDSEDASAPVVETPAPVAAEPSKPQPEAVKPAPQRLSPEVQAPTEADAARDQSLQRINAIVQQLEVTAAGKFADLKTEQDVLQLMQTDPNRYNEFVIAQTHITRARQAQQQVHAEANKAYIAGEQQKLEKAIPDLSDPEKAPALTAKLRAYAKSQGIPDNRQARSADEVIRLHREMTLAEELNTLKSEKAAQAAALAEAQNKARGAPPVQKPGVQRETNKDEKVTTDLTRFHKSGKPDDLARFIEHLI